MSDAPPPAGTPPTEKAGGLLAESDKSDLLPAAADDAAAMLLLAAFGPMPIATPVPVVAAPVTQPSAQDGAPPASLLPPGVFGKFSELATKAFIPGDTAGVAPEHAGTARDLIEQAAADPSFGASPAAVQARFAAEAPARAPAAAELRTPVNLSGWDAELGKTLVWMAEGKHSLAELRLNPPELGPLRIMIALGGDDGREARVAFASPHAVVREAIEAALPRLREMMADSGISLGQTAVSAESFQRPGEPGHFRPLGAPAGLPGAGDVAPHPEPAAAARRAQVGIVDLFA